MFFRRGENDGTIAQQFGLATAGLIYTDLAIIIYKNLFHENRKLVLAGAGVHFAAAGVLVGYLATRPKYAEPSVALVYGSAGVAAVSLVATICFGGFRLFFPRHA